MKQGRLAAALLILVALVAAVPVLAGRMQREESNRTVDLVLDLPTFRAVARAEGYDPALFLRQLREVGITAASVPQVALGQLGERGEAVVMLGWDIRAVATANGAMHPLLQRLVNSGRIVEPYTYIVTDQPAVGERLRRDLGLRLPADKIAAWQEQGLDVIEIGYPPEALARLRLNVGYDPRDFELVRGAGLRPVPRPSNQPEVSADDVRRQVEEIARLAPEASTVIFAGVEVLGHPHHLDLTARLFQERGWVIGFVEHYSQLGYVRQTGYEELARHLDYQVVRVHSFDQREIDRTPNADVVEKWVRSAKERNIRVLYLRPVQRTDEGLNLVETNLKHMGNLVQQLQAIGFQPGSPAPYAPHWPWPWLALLYGLGVGGAGLFWLTLIWPLGLRPVLVLAALGALALAAGLYVAPNAGREATALGAAIVFPTLGGTLALQRLAGVRQEGSRWVALLRESVISVALLAGVSLLGGLLVAAVLGDIRYMLEFRFFRGVKVAFVTPLLLTAASYVLLARPDLRRASLHRWAEEAGQWLSRPITWGATLLAAVLLGAAYLMVLRSGNVSPDFPLIQLELKLRSYLEHLLRERPRTKEFLVGYPSLILAVAAWRWRVPLLVPIFVLGGVTGGISVINSFSHLRTPVLLSFMRWVHGGWLGILVGIAGASIAVFLLERWRGGEREAGDA